VNYDKQKRVSE